MVVEGEFWYASCLKPASAVLLVTVEEVLIAIDGWIDGAPECVENLKDWFCVEDKSFDYSMVGMSESRSAERCWRSKQTLKRCEGFERQENPKFGSKGQMDDGEKEQGLFEGRTMIKSICGDSGVVNLVLDSFIVSCMVIRTLFSYRPLLMSHPLPGPLVTTLQSTIEHGRNLLSLRIKDVK